VATVTIERTRTYFGRARRLKVVIDGRVAGSLRHGEVRSFPVGDAEHTVMTKMDWFKSPVVRVDLGDGGEARLLADLPRMKPFRRVLPRMLRIYRRSFAGEPVLPLATTTPTSPAAP
jgi:hypothetical protein